MDAIDIGVRLLEERERLGYNQTSFARQIGISRIALRNIEEGKSDFKMSVLMSAAQSGADIQYIVTGIRSRNADDVEKSVGYTKNVIEGSVTGVGFAQSGSKVTFTNKLVEKTTAVTNPGVEHITEGQRSALKELVDKVVDTEKALKKIPKSHRAVWASLNRHCKVPSYSLIARGDFEKARKYLHMWIGRLNAAPSAPVKNGDDWRKRRYSYIMANTKQPEEKDALQRYMARKYKVESLTGLANDELEAVYRYVAGRKRR